MKTLSKNTKDTLLFLFAMTSFFAMVLAAAFGQDLFNWMFQPLENSLLFTNKTKFLLI